MTEVERHLAGRVNDRAFFRLSRIRDAVRHDPTALLEISVGVLGLGLNGALVTLAVTTLPPPDVEFLLRGWWLTPNSLGLLLLGLGVLQVLGTATRSHAGRAVIAGLACALAVVVTVAYVLANLPTYFQAWVMYLAIAVGEFYLVIRNLRDHRRVMAAEQLLVAKIRARRTAR